VDGRAGSHHAANLPWVSIYWVFTLAVAIVLAVAATARIPRIDPTEKERVGSWESHLALVRMPVVWLYFTSIFLYVGLEQGLSNWDVPVSAHVSQVRSSDDRRAACRGSGAA